MNLKRLVIVTLIVIPFFVSSTEAPQAAANDQSLKPTKSVKGATLDKEKALALVRMLVKSAERCRRWPQCE